MLALAEQIWERHCWHFRVSSAVLLVLARLPFGNTPEGQGVNAVWVTDGIRAPCVSVCHILARIRMPSCSWVSPRGSSSLILVLGIIACCLFSLILSPTKIYVLFVDISKLISMQLPIPLLNADQKHSLLPKASYKSNNKSRMRCRTAAHHRWKNRCETVAQCVLK